MEITLSKVVEAARQRRAAVTAEGGGYIILLALQQLAASPRQVTAELIGLTAAGEIELGASQAAQPREVETQLRQLLASLLSLPQSAPPALKATGERAAVGDLAALEAELTAALIPFNHAAARRTLARLFRETQKAARAAIPSADLAEGEASPPLSGAPRPLGSETPPSSARVSVTSPSLATPSSSKVAAIAAAPGRALTPLPAAAALRSTPPLPAVEPTVQVAPVTAAPLPVALVASAELEIDVEVVLSDGDARAAADAPVLSPMGEAEAVGESCVTVDAAATRCRQELRSDTPSSAGLGASEAAATSHRAPPPPLDEADGADIVDIEVDELDDLDELLMADATPGELRFTSLSAAPLLRGGEDQTSFDSSLPDSSAAPSCAEPEPEPPPYRSDLRELLAGYLSHTRCEEQMTADLRRIIGLEPWRASGAAIHRTELGR